MKQEESETRESVVAEIANVGGRIRAQQSVSNEWKAYLDERWYNLGKHDCGHGV